MENKFIDLLELMKKGEHLTYDDWFQAFKHHGHLITPFEKAVVKTQPKNKEEKISYYGDIRLHLSKFEGWHFDWADERLRDVINYGLKKLARS